MAIVSNVNIKSATTATDGAATCLYYLKETLKSAGWKVLSSSNGTTLTGYPGGTTGPDSITSISTMNSASAWFRITDPQNSREYVCMRGGALTAIWKYSRQTKFTGGSPNATTLPTTGTGGDGVVLIGTGFTESTTTTSAQASALIETTAGMTRLYFVADTEATNGVYPWWFMSNTAVTNYNIAFYSHEGIFSGSCSPLDLDPSWFTICFTSTSNNSIGAFSGAGQTFTAPNGGLTGAPIRAWYKYGLPGASFERGIGLVYAGLSSTSAQTYPANIGSNPYNSKETGISILIRTLNFPKGLSSGIKWKGSAKIFPEIVDDENGKQYLHFADSLLLPWPTGSVAITSA